MKPPFPTLAIFLLATGMLPAAITPYSEDFSSGSGSITGWTSIGTTTTKIVHNKSVRDGDATTPIDAQVDGGGDDVAGDGCLYFDSVNDVPGDETIAYTLGGTMEIGKIYTLDIATFNPNSSWNDYRISLHNKTDNVELATTGSISQGDVTGCRERRLVVGATVADAGDELEIRITENHNHTARNMAVDIVSLSVGTLAQGITAMSQDFSSGVASIAGWASTGAVASVLSRITQANDSDDANYDPAKTDGGGDNSAGDGALKFVTNAIPKDEQISYVFEGSMDLNETYTLDIACYNPNQGSTTYYAVSLWNRTDNVSLVGSANLGIGGGALGCRETQLTYTPGLSDQGDQLEVRIVENNNDISRTTAVDVFSLTVTGGSTPFENFMSGYPDVTGSDALPDADPDGDTLSNVEEFLAGGTAPNDGTAANRPVSAILNDGSNDHLNYSILVPDSASFSGSPSPSAIIAGITVTVRGSLDLGNFDRTVEETTRDSSLPADPTGHAWHTFRLVDPVPAQSRGFLQATYQ